LYLYSQVFDLMLRTVDIYTTIKLFQDMFALGVFEILINVMKKAFSNNLQGVKRTRQKNQKINILTCKITFK
jgi:hypothetical protein